MLFVKYNQYRYYGLILIFLLKRFEISLGVYNIICVQIILNISKIDDMM